MAMEKLILRSVMYGADKIPDSWFEKVPGGFYKSSQKANQKNQDSQKIDGGEGGKKQRRYSHHHDDRRRARRDRYEDEYRSDDNRRNDRRGRSSYDGSYDDDFTRQDRRGGAREGGRRRRRHSVDSDRYGYNDGYSTARDNAYNGDRKYQGQRQARPADPYFDDRRRPVTSDGSRAAKTFPPKAAMMSGGLAGAAAAHESGAPCPQSRGGSVQPANMPSPPTKPAQAHTDAQPQAQTTERPRTGSLANGYVPYAHIYGQTDNQPAPSFPPPPTSAHDTSQSGFAAPPQQQSFQQNPFAQRMPPGADAGARPQHNAQTPYAPQPMRPPTSARAFAGYENVPPYPESPRPGRATDRYSPSYATSHERRDSDGRRTRSERRPDGAEKGGRYQGNI